MKKSFSDLFAALAGAFTLFSCDPQVEPDGPDVPDVPEGKVELVAPVLSANATAVEVSEENLQSAALTLSWTSAVPKDATVSLSYVVYANLASVDLYTSPKTIQSRELSLAFTGSELNALVAELKKDVADGDAVELQFSVYARPESDEIEAVVSNIVKATVTTYKEKIDIPSTLYIVGSATTAGWDKSKGIPVQKGGDGKYTAEGVELNLTITDTGFKFYFSNDDSSALFFGPDLSSDTFGKTKLYTEDDGSANLFQPALNGYTTGVYTIVLDVDALMTTLTRTGDIEYNIEFGDAVYPQGSCFPWGWSFDGPMEKTADKVYEVKGVKCYWGDNGDSGFKIFIANGVWSPYFAQGDDATKDNVTIKLVTDSDVPQFFPGLLGYESGTYDIKADFNTMVLTLTKVEDEDPGQSEYDENTAIFLFGDGFEKYTGWTFDRALALIPQGDGTYVSESKIYINKWCYFKLEMKDWTEWVRDSAAGSYWTATKRTHDPDNDCNFVPGDSDGSWADGDYTVVFDKNNLTLTLTPDAPALDENTAIYLFGGDFFDSADWEFDNKNALVPVGENIYKSLAPIHLKEWTYFKLEMKDWTEWVPNKATDEPWDATERTHDPDNDGTFSVGNVGLKDGYYNVEFNRGTKMLTVTAAE